MPKGQTSLSVVQDIIDRVKRGETVHVRWGDVVRGYSGGTIDRLIDSIFEGSEPNRALIVDLWGCAPTAVATIVYFHLERVEIVEEEQNTE